MASRSSKRQGDARPEGLPDLFGPCAIYAAAAGPTHFVHHIPGFLVRWYVRVSTQQQANEETHEAQIHAVQERARAEGWGQAIIYVEPGRSGETLDGRPIMRQFLADVTADPGDAVGAAGLDRFCRSQALAPWGEIAETFKNAGVRVLAQGLSLDLSEPVHALMFTMMGPGLAGFEKALIMSRLNDGKRRAARAGRKPGGPTPWPLAYDRETKLWSLPQASRDVARRLIDLALDGLTTPEIAALMAEERHSVPESHPKRRALTWDYRLVAHHLRKEVLKGEWPQPSYDTAIEVPAVCTPAEWDRVQQQLDLRQRVTSPGRPAAEPVDWQKRTRCGVCQERAYVEYRGKKGRYERYYTCKSKTGAGKRAGLRPCGAERIRCDQVDRAAWALIVQMVEEPALLRDACADSAGEAEADRLRAEAESIQARLDNLDRGQRILTHHIAAGHVDADDAEKALRDSALRRAEARARLDEIEGALATMTTAATSAADLTDRIEALRGELRDADDDTRREIIAAICPNPIEHGLWIGPGRRIVVRGALGGITHAGSTGADGADGADGCGGVKAGDASAVVDHAPSPPAGSGSRTTRPRWRSR